MSENLYLALGLVAAMYIAWNLGANDSANPTNMAVGAGVLSVRRAVLLFCLFAAVGALVQGYMVIKTIGKGVVRDIPPLGALISSVVAGLWITLATYKGIPVSTTHSTVGAVLGIGLAGMFSGREASINWSVVYKVILSWITSPLAAMTLSIILYFTLTRLAEALASRGVDVEKWYRLAFIPALAFSAYAFGSNDVGNATGVYLTIASRVTGLPDRTTMFFLALLGSVGIAAGAFTWGYRVITTVGFRITRLDYVSGLSAQLANALCVWLFTTIPMMLIGYGMPISTTHASVSSVIGVGIAKSRGFSGVNWKTVAIIIASWILTLPVTAGISFLVCILVGAC